uniref:Androgen-induced gene 1 protein n=1 Tax=Parascaris univalens TaxID=6257 RepID=A0A915BY37_PARUN
MNYIIRNLELGMGAFRVVIYGLMAGVFCFTLGHDFLYMPRIGHSWWIYKLVMLTMINLTLQSVYYAMCVVCAVMDYLTEKKDRGPHTRHPSAPSYWRYTKLHRICDFMYYIGTFPVGVATCGMFWALYAVDPTLVMPMWAEKLIPRFVNHVTHTAPIPFILVDTLLTCHHAPPRKIASIVSIALVTGYFFIIFAVRLIDDYWLYPFMEDLNVFYFAIFYIASCILFWLLVIFGDILNTILWGDAPHSDAFLTRRKTT